MSVDDHGAIRRAQASDFESLLELLAGAHLPTDYLTTAPGLGRMRDQVSDSLSNADVHA